MRERIAAPQRVTLPTSEGARSIPYSDRATWGRTRERTRGDIAVTVVLVTLVVILAVSLIVTGGLPGVQTFATIFLGIFIEAMPFVLLGVLVSAVIGSFVRDETISRILPRGRISGPLVGSLLGLLFPVCECGVVPVTRRFLNKGASVGLGVSFLFASPVINPIVLWSTYTAFGGDWHILAWRAGLTFAIATVIGVVFALHPNGRSLLRFPLTTDHAAPQIIGEFGRGGRVRPLASGQPHMTLPQRLQIAAEHAAAEFFEMGKFLVLGALLASLFQSVIPRQTLLAVGQSPITSVFVMIILAVILSVCSTVDAFLVLTFAGTFTTGAILAFLVFGPMVDLKSTLMFLTVFKGRAVALMIALAAVLVLLATLAINLNVS